MRKKIGAAILAGLILAAGYAVATMPHRPAASQKVQVTASFYPMGEFARQVGGDLVDVTVLVKPGVEPHDYDPTPQDMVRVQRSKLLVYNGAGLEPWADKVKPELERNGVVVVQASAGLDLLTKSGEEDGEVPSGGYDPHVWLDPALAARQVEAVKAGLVKADPAHAAIYERNAADYERQLADLDAAFTSGLAQCGRRDIVTSHQAFAYLGRHYGLQVEAIAGLSPDEEPSPAKLAEVATFVRDHNVKYIFFESLASPKMAQTIAAETGAQTLVFNPLEGLTPDEVAAGANYVSVQQHNLENLKTALDCN